MMKNRVILILLLVLLIGCKKDDSNSTNQIDLAKLPGTWKFISETRTGDDNSSYRSEFLSEKITYQNGKAYHAVQSQAGSSYDYNLNTNTNTLIFQFLGYGCNYNCQLSNISLWTYLVNGVGGFRKEAKIQRLDDNYLILGNSFTVYDTTQQKNLVVIVVDSLSR